MSQNYNDRAEQLVNAISIAEKIIKESMSMDEDSKKHFIDFGQQIKELALDAPPKFKSTAHIKQLENDFLTYWNESNGIDVEMFWRLLTENEITFERKDTFKKVLIQKRIKNRLEYDHVIGGIVTAEQTGRITSDDAIKLNQYLEEFERRKKTGI